MTTCNTLNIPIIENFEQVLRTISEKPVADFKLSRFACYLVVMNADNKMPIVAQAQAYFASLAGAVQNYLDELNQIERLNVREEVSEREKSLQGVVSGAGIESFALFQNAGYRGMYNRNLRDLKIQRRVDINRSLLDFMGKEELAANLFRITQTELKIKQDVIIGQKRLEATAETVGKQVRKTMIEISGIAPEQLAKNEDIKDVRKKLKNKSKEIKKIDKKKSK